MAQPHRRNQTRQPNQQRDNSNSSTNQGEELQNTNQNTITKNQFNERHGITENIVIIKKEKWTRADKISVLALLVGAILAFFTYRLYNTAVEDSKTANTSATAANKSAEIAQKTLDETRRYDSVSLIKQQSALDSSSASNTQNFERQKKSLNLQDSSLKETQKEFDIENQAYLQIGDFDTLAFKGNMPNIHYFISNLGKQPAKILKGYIVSYIDSVNKDPMNKIRAYEEKQQPYKDENIYVVKEAPQGGSDFWPVSIDEFNYGLIKARVTAIFIFGRYKYQNLITKKIRLYKFCARVSFEKRIIYNMIYNDNIDL